MDMAHKEKPFFSVVFLHTWHGTPWHKIEDVLVFLSVDLIQNHNKTTREQMKQWTTYTCVILGPV